MEKQGLKFIGSGTEGEVYTDGQKAYKFIPLSCVTSLEEVRSYIGHNYPNVVEILDAYVNPDDEDELIIVMELLQEIEYDTDLSYEFGEAIHEETFDVVEYLGYLINEYRERLDKEPELLRMARSIILAAKQLRVEVLDMGFHNLMYCQKTNEYKQIDIF